MHGKAPLEVMGLSMPGPARVARGRIHRKLGRAQAHRSRAMAPPMMSRHIRPLHRRRAPCHWSWVAPPC
ncbi:hypothetical protein D7W79_09155 [Corallococcus exercitus]|nr:hypothetical protein D7W79_09155 [Corallococcus exercitus]